MATISIFESRRVTKGGNTTIVNQGGVGALQAPPDTSGFAKLSVLNEFKANNIFKGDVTIEGNLLQTGKTYQTNIEEVLIKSNLNTINDGEIGAGVSGSLGSVHFSGWKVDRGTEDPFYWGFNEDTNRFSVGREGELQAVAAIQDSPTADYPVQWDATNNRLISVSAVRDSNRLGNVVASNYARTDVNETFNAKVWLGGQIVSSNAKLQVKGFMRTGNIYLHTGGGTPNNDRSNDYLQNDAGIIKWYKNGSPNTIYNSGNSNKSDVDWNANRLNVSSLAIQRAGGGLESVFSVPAGENAVHIDTGINVTGISRATNFRTTGIHIGDKGKVADTSSLNLGVVANNYGYGISTNAVGGLDVMANQSGQPIRLWSGSPNETPTISAMFYGNAEVSLYYAGVKKFGTTSTGTTTTGNHTVTKSLYTSGFTSTDNNFINNGAYLGFYEADTTRANRLFVLVDANGALFKTDYSSGGSLDIRFQRYNTEVFRIESAGTTTQGRVKTVTNVFAGSTATGMQLVHPDSSANSGVSIKLAPSTAYSSRYAAIEAVNNGGNVIDMVFKAGNDSVIAENFRVHRYGTKTTGNHTATGYFIADTHYTSSDSTITLSSGTTNGSVYLRPDGKGSTSAQSIFSTTLANIGTDTTINGYIGSPSYTSGITGTGWRISQSANGELTNLDIRESLTCNTFTNNQINISNGDLIVSDHDEIEKVLASGTTHTNFYFSKEQPFQAGDVLRCQGSKQAGNIKSYYVTVASVGTSTSYKDDDGEFMKYIRWENSSKTGAGIPEVGDILVRWNSSNAARKGLLYLSSSSTYSPFYDVVCDGATVSRFGKLDGITSSIFGNLSGYGFWTQNGYLEGAINAKSGRIGAWDIDTTKLSSPNASIILRPDALHTNNSAGRILLGNWNTGSRPTMRLVGDTTSKYVEMYYSSASDWGIRGTTDGTGVRAFELGSTNSISGFTFNNTQLYKVVGNNTIAMGTKSGTSVVGFHILNGGSTDNRVSIGYANNSTWGIWGNTGGSEVFRLGDENRIAGWNFSNIALSKGDSNGFLQLDSNRTSIKVRKGTLWGYVGQTYDVYSGYTGHYGISFGDEGVVKREYFRIDSGVRRIAGWSFDDNQIHKGNIHITTGLSGIYCYDSGNKWVLRQDGSGSLASGAISWDTLGNVTFTDSVKLKWSNVTDTTALTNTITTAQNKANDAYSKAVNAQNDVDNKTDSWVTTITNNTVTSSFINGRNCQFTQGKIGSFTIGSSYIHSNVDSKFLTLQNSENDIVHAGARRGLNLYVNNDKLTSANSVKIIQLGMLCNKDTANAFPTTPNYGFRITKGNGTYKDIFRADASGAFIANWSFNENYLWSGSDTPKTSNGFADSGITLSSGGAIRAENFRIDTDGNAFFKGDISGASGTFSGTINANDGNIGGWNITTTGLGSGSGSTRSELLAGEVYIGKSGTGCSIYGVNSGTANGSYGTMGYQGTVTTLFTNFSYTGGVYARTNDDSSNAYGIVAESSGTYGNAGKFIGNVDIDGNTTLGGGVTVNVRNATYSTTLNNNDYFVTCTMASSSSRTVKLPASPVTGRVIKIKRRGGQQPIINGNGKSIYWMDSSAVSSLTIDWRHGAALEFIYDGTYWCVNAVNY